MDASHLLPTAAMQLPHPQESSSDGHRGSISYGPGRAVESSAERSHDAQQSTGGWGRAHSAIGARIRKPRKTLVLCFDGTGES